jgi:microcystin-dependent protein
MFAGNFAPASWAKCDGSPLPISENEALFQLLGTTYGGDGESTFNLPDLRGRIPIHQGNGFVLAEAGGVEDVTLTVNQIPNHTHPVIASTGPGSVNAPTNNVFGVSSAVKMFLEDDPLVSMNAAAVASTGGSQPHTNVQPYLCVNFIIALFGIFPTQT